MFLIFFFFSLYCLSFQIKSQALRLQCITGNKLTHKTKKNIVNLIKEIYQQT